MKKNKKTSSPEKNIPRINRPVNFDENRLFVSVQRRVYFFVAIFLLVIGVANLAFANFVKNKSEERIPFIIKNKYLDNFIEDERNFAFRNHFHTQNFIGHIHDICHSENPLRWNRNLTACFKLHDKDGQRMLMKDRWINSKSEAYNKNILSEVSNVSCNITYLSDGEKMVLQEGGSIELNWFFVCRGNKEWSAMLMPENKDLRQQRLFVSWGYLADDIPNQENFWGLNIIKTKLNHYANTKQQDQAYDQLLKKVNNFQFEAQKKKLLEQKEKESQSDDSGE